MVIDTLGSLGLDMSRLSPWKRQAIYPPLITNSTVQASTISTSAQILKAENGKRTRMTYGTESIGSVSQGSLDVRITAWLGGSPKTRGRGLVWSWESTTGRPIGLRRFVMLRGLQNLSYWGFSYSPRRGIRVDTAWHVSTIALSSVRQSECIKGILHYPEHYSNSTKFDFQSEFNGSQTSSNLLTLLNGALFAPIISSTLMPAASSTSFLTSKPRPENCAR